MDFVGATEGPPAVILTTGDGHVELGAGLAEGDLLWLPKWLEHHLIGG